MSRSTLSAEDIELNQLNEHRRRLEEQQRELAKIPERLAREQKERETTMPPLADLVDRMRAKEHQRKYSRGEVSNVLRDQNRSLLLLLLLLTATGTLIWWGMQLMRG